MGCQLSAVSQVDRLCSKTLHVRVADKKWVQALKSLEKMIIYNLNNHMKPDLVNSLAFHEDIKIFCETQVAPSQILKKSHQLSLASGAKKRPLKMINDRGLKEILWRLEQKLRFPPLVAGLILLGFVSNCTTGPAYQTGKTPSSGTYGIKKTISINR